jgi:hypothetical protein
MDRPPEHAFGADIQILDKPLFRLVLARTVRRRADIPLLGAEAEDADTARERLRAHLRAELDSLKAEVLDRADRAGQRGMWDILVLLVDACHVEGLRQVLNELRARER